MVKILQELTLLPEATRANLLALPEAKKRKMIHATSGRKCAELLHKQNPLGQFAKTFMATSLWDWTVCCTTWKPLATPANRLLFQLSAQVQTITGSEFLLWPTPQAMDAMKARPPEAMARQMNTARKGRKKIATMKDAAVYGLEWTGEAVRLGDGELSPLRLEWMMNYPIGWTEINH